MQKDTPKHCSQTESTAERIEKMKAPEYLHNPETCPCEGGRQRGCPNNRHCDLCQANHHSKPNSPYTACEKKALAEFGTLEFD